VALKPSPDSRPAVRESTYLPRGMNATMIARVLDGLIVPLPERESLWIPN
jgi:hypothetical protein